MHNFVVCFRRYRSNPYRAIVDVDERRMENANEEFLLLLLSDSNLPTGGFIASSGLESYLQHGYLIDPSNRNGSKSIGILDFVAKSIHSYARLNLPFLSASHEAGTRLRTTGPEEDVEERLEEAQERIRVVDRLFEAMTLNSVSKRASVAQGIALLTLYDKSFSPPTIPGSVPAPEKTLVERLRTSIRAKEKDSFGHHPIGFGIITSALSLPLPAAQNIFLFLHARSILSSAIRLNIIGPYISHRLLLHDVRPLIAQALDECKDLQLEKGTGPVVSWPLGEILAARHDALHSKIFNS